MATKTVVLSCGHQQKASHTTRVTVGERVYCTQCREHRYVSGVVED